MTRLSPLSGLIPRVPAVARLGFRTGRAYHPHPEYDISDEEQDSLLKSLGRKALGGVAVAGNVLDTPGSTVRNLLSGNYANVLPGLASPFSGEFRASGRDMLEKWGVLRPNKPGLDWGDPTPVPDSLVSADCLSVAERVYSLLIGANGLHPAVAVGS